jgi:hypothetical protein
VSLTQKKNVLYVVVGVKLIGRMKIKDDRDEQNLKGLQVNVW